jgi:creatinine amidohydrolase/Fe(II)-dependent formamide hydrolase-like protein
MGDATKATAEKGRLLLDACADGIVELVDEIRLREQRPRKDHH